MKKAYDIYVGIYGKLKLGEELSPYDWGEQHPDGLQEYEGDEKLAVTLAIDDFNSGIELRTRSGFERELVRLNR